MIPKHQRPKCLNDSSKVTWLGQLNRTKPARPPVPTSVSCPWSKAGPSPAHPLRLPQAQPKALRTRSVRHHGLAAIIERITSPHQMSCVAWPHKCTPSSVLSLFSLLPFLFHPVPSPLPSCTLLCPSHCCCLRPRNTGTPQVMDD